jgi:hypothetical protein
VRSMGPASSARWRLLSCCAIRSRCCDDPACQRPEAQRRQELLRRATLYTVSFFAAGLGIALVGGAFVAWLLTWRGQPFLRSWLIATAIIIRARPAGGDLEAGAGAVSAPVANSTR